MVLDNADLRKELEDLKQISEERFASAIIVLSQRTGRSTGVGASCRRDYDAVIPILHRHPREGGDPANT